MRIVLVALALALAPGFGGCLEGGGDGDDSGDSGDGTRVDDTVATSADPAPPGPPPASEAARPEFLPPHSPPTRDPVEPYDFDPSLPVQLSRNGSGVLSRDCGTRLENGSYERFCPEQREPAGCDPDQAQRPTEHTDADQDRIFDDFERHMARTFGDAQREKVQALVDFGCPITWALVLDLREQAGPFPVNTLWSTGFSADLTQEQVLALAGQDEVRAVDGVRHVKGHDEAATQDRWPSLSRKRRGEGKRVRRTLAKMRARRSASGPPALRRGPVPRV